MSFFTIDTVLAFREPLHRLILGLNDIAFYLPRGSSKKFSDLHAQLNQKLFTLVSASTLEQMLSIMKEIDQCIANFPFTELADEKRLVEIDRKAFVDHVNTMFDKLAKTQKKKCTDCLSKLDNLDTSPETLEELSDVCRFVSYKPDKILVPLRRYEAFLQVSTAIDEVRNAVKSAPPIASPAERELQELRVAYAALEKRLQEMDKSRERAKEDADKLRKEKVELQKKNDELRRTMSRHEGDLERNRKALQAATDKNHKLASRFREVMEYVQQIQSMLFPEEGNMFT